MAGGPVTSETWLPSVVVVVAVPTDLARAGVRFHFQCKQKPYKGQSLSHSNLFFFMHIRTLHTRSSSPTLLILLYRIIIQSNLHTRILQVH